MSVLIWIVLFLAVLLAGFVWWASRSRLSELGNSHKFVNWEAPSPAPSSPEAVSVMSWNMAWGHGMGSEGVNYRPKDRDHFVNALDSIADTIEQEQADIVLLQEVDFDSGRSHHIDQLEYLGKKLGMNFAYAYTWDVNYVPFPYWPVKKHFKKMNSGGGVLSRFPFLDNQVFLHEKPAENPWWYNIFYLYRFTQITWVKIGEKKMAVVNNHLEAFQKKNRAIQAQVLAARLKTIPDILAVGGDFNTTPDIARQKSRFEGYPRDDYEDDSTYRAMTEGAGLEDALSKEEYLLNEKKWFTFSSANPTRKLDYIFVKKGALVEELEVIQTPVSDHFPVLGRIRFS